MVAALCGVQALFTLASAMGSATPVGHEAGCATHAEEAVGDEAGAVVPGVVIVGDVLVRHNEHPLVGHRLQPSYPDQLPTHFRMAGTLQLHCKISS